MHHNHIYNRKRNIFINSKVKSENNHRNNNKNNNTDNDINKISCNDGHNDKTTTTKMTSKR